MIKRLILKILQIKNGEIINNFKQRLNYRQLKMAQEMNLFKKIALIIFRNH